MLFYGTVYTKDSEGVVSLHRLKNIKHMTTFEQICIEEESGTIHIFNVSNVVEILITMQV